MERLRVVFVEYRECGCGAASFTNTCARCGERIPPEAPRKVKPWLIVAGIDPPVFGRAERCACGHPGCDTLFEITHADLMAAATCPQCQAQLPLQGTPRGERTRLAAARAIDQSMGRAIRAGRVCPSCGAPYSRVRWCPQDRRAAEQHTTRQANRVDIWEAQVALDLDPATFGTQEHPLPAPPVHPLPRLPTWVYAQTPPPMPAPDDEPAGPPTPLELLIEQEDGDLELDEEPPDNELDEEPPAKTPQADHNR
jgi:ribosomal protein L32